MSYVGVFSLPFTAFGAINGVPVVSRADYCPTVQPFLTAVFSRSASLTQGEAFVLLMYYTVFVCMLYVELFVIWSRFRGLRKSPVEVVVAIELLKAGDPRKVGSFSVRVLHVNLWSRIVGILSFSILLIMVILFPGSNLYGYSSTGLLTFSVNSLLSIWSLRELGGYPMQFCENLYSNLEVRRCQHVMHSVYQQLRSYTVFIPITYGTCCSPDHASPEGLSRHLADNSRGSCHRCCSRWHPSHLHPRGAQPGPDKPVTGPASRLGGWFQYFWGLYNAPYCCRGWY
jgi:hypothetical protein